MTGIITSLPPAIELPPGATGSNPTQLAGFEYIYAYPNLQQTWTALQTFTYGSIALAGTIGGITYLDASPNATGVLTFPSTTDTLVGQNTTDVLTNKSIDGAANTLTNIPPAALGANLANLSALSATGIVRHSTSTTWAAGATVSVAEGGTGATTLTGILVGNGTGAFTAATGTNNYIPKWSSNSLTGTSLLQDDGATVTVGTASVDANVSLSGGTGTARGSVVSFNGQGVTSTIGTTAKIFGAGTGFDLTYFAGTGADQVFYTGSTERLRIRNGGTYSAVMPAPSNWSSLATVSSGADFNLNGYAVADRQGGNTVGTVEALNGLIKIHSTAIGNQANGVSGYAQTASTTCGAVGGYFQGGALANSVSTFGINAVFTNSPGQASAANTGFDSVTGYGVEIDMNFNKLAGGTTPTSAFMRGLLITGGAATGSRPAGGGFYGTYITPANAFDGSVKWNYAHYVARGSADVGLYLGPTGFTGNSQSSQPIQMVGVNGSGTFLTAQINADSGGNINYAPGSGGSHLFLDGAFAAQFSVDGTAAYARQTTQATSTTSGAIRTDGGLGVVKNAYIGGTLVLGGVGVNDAWSAFTPSVSVIGGTVTTGTVTGAYKIIGKLMLVRASIQVTGGAAPAALTMTLPASATANGNQALSCARADDVASSAKVASGSGNVIIIKYDGTSAVTSTTYYVNGFLEVN